MLCLFCVFGVNDAELTSAVGWAQKKPSSFDQAPSWPPKEGEAERGDGDTGTASTVCRSAPWTESVCGQPISIGWDAGREHDEKVGQLGAGLAAGRRLRSDA